VALKSRVCSDWKRLLRSSGNPSICLSCSIARALPAAASPVFADRGRPLLYLTVQEQNTLSHWRSAVALRVCLVHWFVLNKLPFFFFTTTTSSLLCPPTDIHYRLSLPAYTSKL